MAVWTGQGDLEYLPILFARRADHASFAVSIVPAVTLETTSVAG